MNLKIKLLIKYKINNKFYLNFTKNSTEIKIIYNF